MEPIRLLLCEDEGLTALRLERSLERLGYSVVASARDGAEAVDAASRLRPDVILMDINMPVLDGIEATRRIMRDTPTTIVMLTAHSDREMIEQALRAGASGYLVKPVVDEQLRPAISMAWARFIEASTFERALRTLQESSVREREVARQALRIAREAERLAENLRHQLVRERDAARALAQSFLCPTPDLPGWDIASCYEPASEAALVGGDYFDFIDLAPGSVGIVIGDVCGKGARAAGFTAMARYMLRAYAAEDPAPARALGRLNRALWERMSEECAFVTMIYGVLELQSRRFTYANAGHPAAILCGPAAEDRALGTTGCVLGALAEADYTQETVEIGAGAALALYTDGISEARRAGEMLGETGVHALVRESLHLDAAGSARAILEGSRTFADGVLRDDVAIVVIRSR